MFNGVNMQINVTADYAIRIILYLAIQNKVTNSKDIAMAMRIPKSYILKLLINYLQQGLSKESWVLKAILYWTRGVKKYPCMKFLRLWK